MINRLHSMFHSDVAALFPEMRPRPAVSAIDLDMAKAQFWIHTVLTYQEYNAPPTKNGDASLRMVYQGNDFPGALQALTNPIAERGIGLSHVRFKICGSHRRHYQADLTATGSPVELCAMAAELNENPVRHEQKEGWEFARTVTLHNPWVADLRAVFYLDEPGIVNKLAALTTEINKGDEVAVINDIPVAVTGSLLAVKARVLELDAKLENEIDCAFGGVGGFEVSARIASPTRKALERIVAKWQAFCEMYGILRNLSLDDRRKDVKLCEFDRPKLRDNKLTIPTQFLTHAAA